VSIFDKRLGSLQHAVGIKTVESGKWKVESGKRKEERIKIKGKRKSKNYCKADARHMTTDFQFSKKNKTRR